MTPSGHPVGAGGLVCRALFLVFLLAGCGGPPRLHATARPGGVEVTADEPLTSVEIDRGGKPVVRRDVPSPSDVVWVDVPWSPGDALVARGTAPGGTADAPVDVPAVDVAADVALEAPLGQDDRPVADGDAVSVALVGGSSVPVGVVLTARRPASLVVDLAGRREEVDLRVPGERRVVVARVAGPADLRVTGDLTATVHLDAVALDRAEAERRLVVASTTFPANAGGEPDLARPPGRVTLPAPWWEAFLRDLGLGFRAADSQVPWADEAVTLDNRGDDPLNVVVRTRVVDDEGLPVHAFRPRLREANGQLATVTALVRVPAHGSATALLPLFVDHAEAVPGAWTRELEVLPLGASEPLVVRRDPLYVSRGSGWASAGLAVALLSSLAGLAVLGARLRHWLAVPTSELTTIALFGSLQFVVAVGSQLVAVVMVALLGPFSALVSGLVDDAFRAALLATLVTLLPRPGVASTSLLAGYLLRVLAMGSFAPVDVVYLGAAVAFVEGALWVSGLTRKPSWRDERPLARWARLSLALGASNVLQAATGLVVHVAFYRLFFAGWYVAMILAIPSFLYVLVACAFAVPFADSLRRVET